ncbi:MAG: Ig-like domain-containing protein [Planctomycetota bacterium]
MRHHGTLAALAALAAACSGGGGGGAGSGTTQTARYGLITALAHEPADGTVQVPLAASIVIEFDAAIALDSLGDEDTWLRVAGSTNNVPGRFTANLDQSRVTFTPLSPLARETDYEFQLSGLTCDDQGRLLDAALHFAFRTLDETPPQLLGVDVQPGEQARSRTGTFTYTFSEAIAAASLSTSTLRLRDVFGASYAGGRTAVGNTVVFAPFADLPGDRLFTLELTAAVTDRAGNPLGATSSLQFTTANDPQSPSVLTMWPAQAAAGISPAVQPTYTFSESMDPGTVEPASLAFQDQFGSLVPFAIHSSADQRTLRVAPLAHLQPNRTYTLAFLLGAAATTDVSGNVLAATAALQFTTGTDTVPPAVASTVPADGQTRVSRNAVLEVHCSEALDPAWVDDTTVRLTAGGEELVAVVALAAADTVRITPVLDLPVATTCTVTLQGGHEGLHDVAGNVMAGDRTFSFTTSADATLPRALVAPPDGATSVPRGAHVTIVFDAAMDPATMTNATIEVMDDLYNPVPGTLEILQQNRVARFTPAAPFSALTHYRTRVRGGSGGVRRTSGNWFAIDQETRFRTGIDNDTTSPIVLATLNGIDAARSAGLVLPHAGFTIEVELTDPGDHSLDMGSVEVLLTGTGTGPSAATLYAVANVDYSTFQVAVPEATPLASGSWSLRVRATDLSGNVATSTPLDFEVTDAAPAFAPFERVQVVWVRTDLDRDGTGTPDFEEDMLRLGLGAEGDPLGANARLRQIVLDGIIATANAAYGRGSRGEPLDSGSVWLRFTRRAPIAIAHMQMALGGFDPEGPRGRTYAGETTGVLGRALRLPQRHRRRAQHRHEPRPRRVPRRDVALPDADPRAGVAVLPDGVRAALPAAGARHGRRAGRHRSARRHRARTRLRLRLGARQPARALAHDHARRRRLGDRHGHHPRARGRPLGRARRAGPTPSGLYGDNSLHDTYAGAAEIMAPSVGYEAMLTLDYHFRDIDLAYLRQRILLR